MERWAEPRPRPRLRAFRFSNEELAHLRYLAERDGTTQANVLRRALDLYTDSTRARSMTT